MTTTRVILTSPWRTKLAAKFGGSDKADNIGATIHNDDDDDDQSQQHQTLLHQQLQTQQQKQQKQLSDAVQKIARKELREDRLAREQCTQQMRDWLAKNEDVANVRTDDDFLLRFLRVKKFSVPMAEQMLLKYLNLRRCFPEMTTQLDYQSETMKRVFDNGYLVVSPFRDQHGRRVMIVTTGNFDPHTFNSAAQGKAHFIALEALLADPTNQVLGFTHVLNMQGATAAHVTNWNPRDFARSLRWGEQSWPARHKGVHCINLPGAVRFVMDFARTRLSSKMRDRVMVHASVKDMQKHVDPACLPAEMGGTMPLAEMNKLWHRELAATRDQLLALDRMVLHSDRAIITSKREKSGGANGNNGGNGGASKTELQAHVDSVAGSFRKLEFD